MMLNVHVQTSTFGRQRRQADHWYSWSHESSPESESCSKCSPSQREKMTRSLRKEVESSSQYFRSRVKINPACPIIIQCPLQLEAAANFESSRVSYCPFETSLELSLPILCLIWTQCWNSHINCQRRALVSRPATIALVIFTQRNSSFSYISGKISKDVDNSSSSSSPATRVTSVLNDSIWGGL